MKHTSRRAVLALGLAMAASILLANALGQETSPWVGKKVVTRQQTPLRVGKTVVNDDGGHRVYTVEKVNGRWLWLVSGSIAGWSTSDQVVPLDQALDYYALFTRSTQAAWAFGMRGLIWDDQKEYDKAIADYSESIRLDPSQAGIWTNRGITLGKMKEYDKAIADLGWAIRLDPEDAVAYHNRGAAWAYKKEFEKALADCNEAVRLDPKGVLALVVRGGVWCSTKEYDKAIADLNEAIRLDPTYAQAFVNRGGVWAITKEGDKAVADCNEAIRLDPKDAVAFNNRGVAWGLKGEYDKAMADCNEAIRLCPSLASAYFVRSQAWAKRKAYDKAIDDDTQAIRLDPGYGPAYNGRAWLWATCPNEGSRDGKRAVESALRACELSDWKDPADIDTLAAAYAEAGDFDKAVESQVKATNLLTDDRKTKDYQGRLDLYKKEKPYRDEG